MRNIHLPDPQPTPAPAAGLPRLRSVTNDPAREYAQRPGEVEPLPDSIAALILCKRGYAIVERHQIKVTMDTKTYFFASSASVTIAEKNGTGEKVLWVINRHAPDVLHILGRDGEYIESIPRKGRADWFSNDAASKEALAETRRMRQRDMTRLQQIHQPDTAAALEREQDNTRRVAKLVNTFPASTPARHVDASAPSSRQEMPLEVPGDIDGSEIELGCLPERKALGRSKTDRHAGRESLSTPPAAAARIPSIPRAERIAAGISRVDARRSQFKTAVKRDEDLAAEADAAFDEMLTK